MGSLSQRSIMGTTKTWSLLLLCVATMASSQDTDKIITKVEIDTNIMYRYAQTVVKSTTKNLFNTSQEVIFKMKLPEMAFISNFTITSEGEEHVAEVLGQDEAIQKYNEAKEMNLTTGLANKDLPKERNFTISVSVRPQEKIVFHLTYDERLERREGSYRYQIYLNSLPQLNEMSAVVNIKESLDITNMTISQADSFNENWSPGNSEVQFVWKPEEKDYDSVMQEGLRVEYAVEERKNEIQVMCGHFIHWFTPDKTTRDKFLVFVLDVSGSMYGERIKPLKNAMKQILTKMMSTRDYFSIITFDDNVYKYTESFDDLTRSGIFRGKYRKKAEKYVNSLQHGGWTDINSALLAGISTAEKSESSLAGKHLAPMVVFLTDGDATAGEQDTNQIMKNVHKRNTQKIPILTLGFGYDSDFTLLQRISAQTDSLSRMIFDGVDARDQLENFFTEIERPTLSNVQFKYIGNVKQDSLSKLYEGQMFSGGEHVVVGETEDNGEELAVIVSADSRDGPVATKTTLLEENSNTDQSHCQYIKRFFAYLKVKQYIKTGQLHHNDVLLERAKNLSLANNFVTDLTSLVVVIEPELKTTNTFISGGAGDGCTGMCVPIDSLDISSLISPEKNSVVVPPCNITLFSGDYHQGESVTFSDSVPDLSIWGWEEKLVSVKVEGTCYWEIYTDESYTGEFLTFKSSQRYLEAEDVGELYSNALSVKKL